MFSSALLILVPWLIFLVLSLCYTFAYHHFPEVVYMIGIAGAALGIMFMTLTHRMDGRWYLFLGVLCLLSVITGNLAGLYNYHLYMFPYYAYNENREYTNVLPSEPAAAHADAGKIQFAKSARIDTTKAVGFKAGQVYCVAPVMDDTQTSRVEYWAAGMNCCNQRADFQCDNSADPTAHNGVVILETNSWIPSHREMYEKAVKVSEAAFDLVSSPDPLFIRWVLDPGKVQDQYYVWGTGTMLASVGIYAFLSLLLGIVCGMSSKRQARQQ